jgi:peptidyl-tRNA hydrolase
MSSKQVIVVRKDLGIPAAQLVGKLAAQVAHAAMGAIKSEMTVEVQSGRRVYTLIVEDDTAMADWWEGSFTKPVLSCKDLAELLTIEEKAKAAGLPVCRITDNGRTVFKGEPTVTCLAIGPAFNEQFDGITSHLRLY